jgi:hypothetical protein
MLLASTMGAREYVVRRPYLTPSLSHGCMQGVDVSSTSTPTRSRHLHLCPRLTRPLLSRPSLRERTILPKYPTVEAGDSTYPASCTQEVALRAHLPLTHRATIARGQRNHIIALHAQKPSKTRTAGRGMNQAYTATTTSSGFVCSVKSL